MQAHLTAEILRDIAKRVEKLPIIPNQFEVDVLVKDLYEVMRLLSDMAEV